MTKVIEYTIVSYTSRDRMVEDVNQRILAGWQPWGGLQVSETLNQPISFTQAMVLCAPTKPAADEAASLNKPEARKAERNKPTTHSR